MDAQTDTTAFLTELLAEAAAFDAELFPPEHPVEQNETVLGDCPESCRKMFALSRYCAREQERAGVELKYITGEDTALLAMHSMNHEKSSILKEIVWASLAHHFQTWGMRKVLGLRTGWKVVTYEDTTGNPIEKLIKMFKPE
jgi:hypothetical protein